MNAISMLSTSKSAFQAEIDAACELIDFLRFNVYYAQQVYTDQPLYSPTGLWNFVQQRPLEGFIFAVAPFNFTAIAGNLATSPAIKRSARILPGTSPIHGSLVKRAARTLSSRTTAPMFASWSPALFAVPSSSRARSARQLHVLTSRSQSGEKSAASWKLTWQKSRWVRPAISLIFSTP